jgi:hypothetical protein
MTTGGALGAREERSGQGMAIADRLARAAEY